MPRKESDERQREKNLKEDLEKLIETDISEITSLVQQAESVLPAKQVGFLNFDLIKKEADGSAKKIVTSIAEFYLDKNIIREIPYIKQKNLVDHITVSNLLFQMKTSEHAIIKLLEQIDSGNTHPRTFEVLASLQRSKMEIVKHLAQFMVVMEQNYKNLKEDYRVKKSEEPTDATLYEDAEDEPTQFRGSKRLIEAIREAIPETRAGGDLRKDEEDGE
jgi:hypothetical protein